MYVILELNFNYLRVHFEFFLNMKITNNNDHVSHDHDLNYLGNRQKKKRAFVCILLKFSILRS